MSYVDGYVIPIPKKNVKNYMTIAKKAAKIWREHGAVEYRESVGDDMDCKWGIPFPKLLDLKAGETVIFAWITYKSRAHRDRVNAKVMKDPRISAMMDESNMPFDSKRMVYGGFEIMVKG
ncbi:MAG TPA: DUF1428 domain-containing protein [Gemmatales bacterium]|nr:DUF1428 domain-containing protein [Gemmatales bacterium]